MEDIFPVILSSLAFPLILMGVKRHYESNPNAWEEIGVTAFLGVAAIAAAVWLFSLEPFEAGSWGAIIVGIPTGWVMLFGLGAVFIAGARAREVIQETREK